MSNTVQSLTGLSVENKTFYDRTLLSRLLPNLLFYKYGQRKPLPQHEGDNVNFRRFNSLEANTTPLTEGLPGDGKTLSISTVVATVAQYGDYITITDKLDMIGIDPVLTETSALLGEQAALSVDSIIRNVVMAGTNVHYASATPGRNNVGSTDIITGDLIRKAVRTLKRADAKPLEGGYFIAIVHPDVAYDIMSDPLWQDVSKYNGGEAIMKGEIGKIHGVRFIESTNAAVNANTSDIDVYGTIILGKDAYGVVDLEGNGAGKPEMIIKDAGSAGTADPLNQVASAGWKCCFTAVRLQELAMVRIESAATPQTSVDDTLDLAALTIGTISLTPAFDRSITSYTASTTDAKNVVTAVGANSGSTVVVKLGDVSQTNGGEVTWASGSNTLTVTVTNAASETRTYTVTVTAS